MEYKEKPKMYIASCSFGKDSIATILLALENNEPLDRVVFAEVMFDKEKGISGEIPEHIEWIYNTAIPLLESMGVKVDVVRAKKDYRGLCNKVLKSGKKVGQKYGHQNCFPCYANSELKIAPIKEYYKQFEGNDIIEYVGIAYDEPKRLTRLKDTNKVSLLEKYQMQEYMAKQKCEEYNLLSPLYSLGYRGGCFFCYNANIERYIHIRKNHSHLWKELSTLYYETNSPFFKFDKTLKDIEREMDVKEWNENHQLSFDFQ
jgi:3'-phosphoadenosine 5'-phosphosulfate sulfotransferase (PAPS reductase)/FAD synthetase